MFALMRRALLAALTCSLMSSCFSSPLEPIRIGVILPLSGDLGSVGESMANAAQLAAHEVNAAGGLLGGREIQVIVLDDETNPDVAVRRFETLRAQGVVAIIGPATSSAVAATQAAAAAAGIVQISPSSTSPALTEAQPGGADRNLFRTAPSDLFQARVLVRHARETEGCTQLAVLYVDDEYGRPFNEALDMGFRAAGGMVVANVAFSGGRPSYASQVMQVASANPDCIALIGFPESAGRILIDWGELSMPPTVTWLGTDGLRDAGLITAAGGGAMGRMRVEGMVGSAPIITPSTPEFNEYGARYRNAFGRADPGVFSANTYDAMAVILLGIQAAGSTEPAAIRAGIRMVATPGGAGDTLITPRGLSRAVSILEDGRDIDYLGASGEVNFDDNGEVLTDYEVWRYESASDMFVRITTIRAEDL